MVAQLPEDDTYRQDRLEGNAAHEVGARLVADAQRGDLTPAERIVGTFSTDGIRISQEIYDCARIYAEHCQDIMRRAGVFLGPYVGIEQRLTMPSVHPECFGTTDFYLYGRVRGYTIDIVDYKHGHLAVDAWENWQLLCYLAGVIDKYCVNGLEDQNTTVRLHIVQPRAYRKGAGPIDTWEFPCVDARAYINRLHTAAEAAMGPNPQCQSGSQCKRCDARGQCPAAITAALELCEAVSTATPHRMDAAHLAVLGAILERAESQVASVNKAVRSQIETMLRAGQAVPSYRMKPVSARKKWVRPMQEVIDMAASMGIDISKPGILTPPQAERAGLAPAIVNMYAQRPAGGMALDRLTTREVRRIFK